MEEEKKINNNEIPPEDEKQNNIDNLFLNDYLNCLEKLLETNNLISEMESYRKNLYEEYDNYVKVKDKLKKLINNLNFNIIEAKTIDFKEIHLQNIKNKKEKIENIIAFEEKEIDSFKNAYGAALEKELKKYNISLKGNYPNFKIAFFTVQMKLNIQNLKNYNCTIWFGPKIERLIDKYSMVPSKLALKIKELIDNLGSKIEEKELFELFKDIYTKLSENYKNKEIPIIKFYCELLDVLKEHYISFQDNSKSQRSFSYSKADFSFDLYKLRNKYPIKLRVATREYTKDRNLHLWVPSNDRGEGVNYSHISIGGSDLIGMG